MGWEEAMGFSGLRQAAPGAERGSCRVRKAQRRAGSVPHPLPAAVTNSLELPAGFCGAELPPKTPKKNPRGGKNTQPERQETYAAGGGRRGGGGIFCRSPVPG